MLNEMHYVTVEHLHAVDNNTVVFTIDLSTHASLRDPAVVQRSMDAYMAQYPNVHTWSAQAAGGWLHITVTGNINNRS